MDSKRFLPDFMNGTMLQWMILSSGFSCFLLLGRIFVSGTFAYLFLPWNLFLAVIPLAISWWMKSKPLRVQNRLRFILLSCTWLLFIPNSFYIITDLFHLKHFESAPTWFDCLMIFSFTWNGLLFGLVSVRQMETMFTRRVGKQFAGLLILMVMLLSGLGIYVGRFLRFNSWDIITDPFSLMGEIFDLLLHPLANSYAWGMTICYAIFMTFLYITIKKWNEMQSV
ncbi:MAG TPA: DUF1361 domain-containing protein [Chitinophagaceae bacterium]|nr:DUF1361 domain-containing protein [Chitinophagaceae bacterium]